MEGAHFVGGNRSFAKALTHYQIVFLNFLMFFILQLVQELQKIGTVPAIDLSEYLKNPAFSIETLRV